MHQLKKRISALAVGAGLALSASTAFAEDPMIEVSITNLTAGQIFSPVLVVSHWRGLQLFKAGEPASDGIATLAESGNPVPLVESLEGNPRLRGHAVGDPVLPGQTVTVKVAKNKAGRVSLASMLVNTNDAFVAINNMSLPYDGPATYTAIAYDAGSEKNDELCVHIPGPACAGQGNEQGGELGDEGEGFVHVHRGVRGVGDMDDFLTDWRNPVARVTIRLVK